MKAAGDVDGTRKLDHGGVIAHVPGAEPFAEIAIQIDRCHVAFASEVFPPCQSCITTCQVEASWAFTALPATLTWCNDSMLRSTVSSGRRRSGRARKRPANLRASACASAIPIAWKRKPVPAGI